MPQRDGERPVMQRAGERPVLQGAADPEKSHDTEEDWHWVCSTLGGAILVSDFSTRQRGSWRTVSSEEAPHGHKAEL